jgi:hypothetical protein
MFVWVLAGGRIFMTSIVDSAIRDLSGNYVTTNTVFNLGSTTLNGMDWAEHPSSTHAKNQFCFLTNKCGNKLKHENEASFSFKLIFIVNSHLSPNISELKQVTFLTTRTLTGSKVDVFYQSQPLTQSSDVTHAVRVVKNVTCLSSLLTPFTNPNPNPNPNLTFLNFFWKSNFF